MLYLKAIISTFSGVSIKMSYTFSLHFFPVTLFEEIIEIANFTYNTLSLIDIPVGIYLQKVYNKTCYINVINLFEVKNRENWKKRCFLMFNNYPLVCISIQIISSSVKGNINTCTQPTIRFTAKYGISQLYPNGHLFLTVKYKIWRCSQTVIYFFDNNQQK